MVMMRDKHLIYTATVKHFEAEREKALVNARIYLNNPTGIGEHGEVVEEFIKMIKKAAEADESLEMVREYFGGDFE